MCILVLDACSKTKSSGTAATTGTGTVGVCTTGYYTAINGQQIPCQIGQQYNTAYTGGGYGQNTWAQGTASCQQYTQYYGVQYIPVNLGGSIECVRYDLVSGYTGGSSYYGQGVDYYYTYPIQASYYPQQGYTYDSGSGFYLDINIGF
jgi:hypothetical protein